MYYDSCTRCGDVVACIGKPEPHEELLCDTCIEEVAIEEMAVIEGYNDEAYAANYYV